VIGDEARLLEGEAQVAQQGADIMRGVQAPELPIEPLPGPPGGQAG
jgi:hypothetical protein